MNKKIITAITIQKKEDLIKYEKYIDISDIILFDSKGYEKSLSFDHSLIKNIKIKSKIMIAGNIKYNDQLEKFNEIANYVSKLTGFKFDIQKIKNSIDSNSFEYLRQLEENGKFSESVHDKRDEEIKFFSLGPKNRWEDVLDQATIKKIEDHFSNEMKELNYIS